MEQAIGRPRVASAYAWLISLAALVVVVQGFLFAAFYSEAEKGFLDAHAAVADISLLVVALIITPLAFLARFPRNLRMGWLTLALAVLWLAQHSTGFELENTRWLEMIHIPLGLGIFGLALYLAGKAHRTVSRRGS